MVARIGVAAAVVCGWVSAAAAGPVTWSYTAKIETHNGGSFAHYGIETHHWYIPPTIPGEVGQEGSTDYQIIANIGAWASGRMPGSTAWSPWSGGVHVSSVGPMELRAYSLDDDWASQLPSQYWLRIRIVDDESAESRDLSYGMHGSSSGFFTSGTGVTNVSMEERTYTFFLGTNQYTVRPWVRGSESAEHIEFDVKVGRVTTTPEPGTVTLVGIGLFGVGLARLRCRSSEA